MSRTTIEDQGGTLAIKKIRPIGDYLLVRMIEKEMSAGGILLPKSKADPIRIAEVLALGQGITDEVTGQVYPFGLKIGDHILFMDYAGERMELRDGSYRMIRAHGVWARVTFRNIESYEINSIEPRMNCVVLEPSDETMTMSGLIYFPNEKNAECPNRIGTVWCVGPGQWARGEGKRKSIELKPGQRVIFMRYAGAEIVVNGKLLRILQDDDIRCTYEED